MESSTSNANSAVRLANSARNSAVRKLIAAHSDDYNTLLAQERAERGLPPAKKSSAQARAEKMIKAMQEMGLDTSAIETQVAASTWAS